MYRIKHARSIIRREQRFFPEALNAWRLLSTQNKGPHRETIIMTHNDKSPLYNYLQPFESYLVGSKFSLHNACHEAIVSARQAGWWYSLIAAQWTNQRRNHCFPPLQFTNLPLPNVFLTQCSNIIASIGYYTGSRSVRLDIFTSLTYLYSSLNTKMSKKTK